MKDGFSFEVLVSTMHQTDYRLLDKMNINSNATVINQCDKNDYDEFNHKGNSIKFVSSHQRGVGKSRNAALVAATSSICLMADDDVEYVDNYKDIIIKAFKNNPSADMIVFNVSSTNKERLGYKITQTEKIKWHNCLRYPTFKMAFKTESQRKSNIFFSLLFGGGAKYSHGEDSLFIWNFVTSGMNVYTCPDVIGSVNHGESTWFEGYNEKYFFDKGALYFAMSKKWYKLLIIQFLLRRKKLRGNLSFSKAYNIMIQGAKDYKWQ